MPRGRAEVVITSPRQVRTANGSLPAALRYRLIGENGDPDFTAEIRVEDGRPEIVRFVAERKSGGRGLRSADIGTSVDELIEAAFAAVGFFFRADGDGRALARIAERARRGRPLRLTPALLEEAARIYRANVGKKPVLAVQREMDLGSRRTAEMYVQRARAAGLLPPTSPGKAKA